VLRPSCGARFYTKLLRLLMGTSQNGQHIDAMVETSFHRAARTSMGSSTIGARSPNGSRIATLTLRGRLAGVDWRRWRLVVAGGGAGAGAGWPAIGSGLLRNCPEWVSLIRPPVLVCDCAFYTTTRG